MMAVQPAQVESVIPFSPAARAGVGPGDRIVTVNGRRPRDYIDYRYLTAEPRVRLLVRDRGGRARHLSIAKPVDRDLGLRFAHHTPNRIQVRKVERRPVGRNHLAARRERALELPADLAVPARQETLQANTSASASSAAPRSRSDTTASPTSGHSMPIAGSSQRIARSHTRDHWPAIL